MSSKLDYAADAALIRRSDELLFKFSRAQANGDGIAVENIRMEMRQVSGDLQRFVDTVKSTALIKLAQTAPKSMFGASPGAAPSHAAGDVWPYSEEARAAMAHTGEATATGGFPIKTAADVSHAVESWAIPGPHRTIAAKKHIVRRATELGALDKLPDDWRGDTAAGGDDPRKFAGGVLRKN